MFKLFKQNKKNSVKKTRAKGKQKRSSRFSTPNRAILFAILIVAFGLIGAKLLGGSQAASNMSSEKGFRVAHLNIYTGMSDADFKHDLNAVMDRNPDLITLNEMKNRSDAQMSIRGYEVWRSKDWNPGLETPVLWRKDGWKVLDKGQKRLSDYAIGDNMNLGRRAANWVTLERKDGKYAGAVVTLVSAHTVTAPATSEYRREIMRTSMANLSELIENKKKLGAVIIGGDFNYDFQKDRENQFANFPIKALGRVDTVSTFTRLGMPPEGWATHKGGVTIDYIYFTTKTGVSPSDHHVYKNVNSDHYMLVSDFKYDERALPAPEPPTKVVLSASSQTVEKGGSVVLSVSSNGATSCKIDPGGYKIDGAKGDKKVANITATTTYRASCSNKDGATNSNQVTVTVTTSPVPVEAPVIAFFTAEPSSIPAGTTSKLSWQTSGVVSGGCVIEPGKRSVANSGSLTTAPLNNSTSYTLTCKNSANVVTSKSVSVTVNSVPPPPAPSPTPADQIKSSPATPSSPILASTNGQRVVDTTSSGSVTQGDLATLDPNSITDADKIALIDRVEYYFNDELFYTATEVPFALDTTGLPEGSHTITQRTYFKDGSMEEYTQLVEVKGNSDSENSESSKSKTTLIVVLISTAVMTILTIVGWFALKRYINR